MTSFLENEKTLCAQIDELCMTDPQSAHELINNLLDECTPEQKSSKVQSAALSRICCRFLMHRKSKSHLTNILTKNKKLRTALFGELNTYKYSLVFLLRRLIRLNDTALTQELFNLLSNNPYRDDSAKDYSDRWSLQFIIDESLNAPEDYLDLSDENKFVIQKYTTPSAD
ncbi:MAG: hypothetical protein IJF40_07375 [Clostridia bacterium]|nr:hypothetical protein [Clostridia bacterium]MBQ7047158.1 hypothetical protein [Oscillospiraceae bacterium]